MAYLDENGNPRVSEGIQAQNDSVFKAIDMLEESLSLLTCVHHSGALDLNHDRELLEMIVECECLLNSCINRAPQHLMIG